MSMPIIVRSVGNSEVITTCSDYNLHISCSRAANMSNAAQRKLSKYVAEEGERDYPTTDEANLSTEGESMGIETPRATFGVELEFLGLYMFLPDGADKETSQRQYPGIIQMRPGVSKDRASLNALQEVIRYLRHNGVDINDYVAQMASPGLPPEAPAITPHSANANDRIYHRWTLKWDTSVRINEDDVVEPGAEGLNFELVTPAMLHDAKSYDEIHRVVSLIGEKYRVVVNSTTGLHVHVGFGPNCMDLSSLKRIAALLWASDAVLNPIHPEDRHNAYYCARNRLHSHLASGHRANRAKPPSEGDSVSIEQGLIELQKCTTSNDVARLMVDKWNDAHAYSFKNYVSGSCAADTPTIEFRQAAGSMNPNWILRWAYICVQMCDWAAKEMEDEDLAYIAQHCQNIEDGEEDVNEFFREFMRMIGCVDSGDFILSTTHDQRARGGPPSRRPKT